MGSKVALGKWGEKVAMTQLEANGFKIVRQNWRCQFGEIDIVAQKEGRFHFIEVKTRKGRGKGSPEEAITPQKAAKMQQTGLMYVGQFGLGEVDWQLDLVAIELDRSGKVTRLEHIPNFVTG